MNTATSSAWFFTLSLLSFAVAGALLLPEAPPEPDHEPTRPTGRRPAAVQKRSQNFAAPASSGEVATDSVTGTLTAATNLVTPTGHGGVSKTYRLVATTTAADGGNTRIYTLCTLAGDPLAHEEVERLALPRLIGKVVQIRGRVDAATRTITAIEGVLAATLP